MRRPQRSDCPALKLAWQVLHVSSSARRTSFLLAVLAVLAIACNCFFSAPQVAAQPPAVQETRRELFVPFEDLNVLLGGDTQRVFMTRAEYAELLAKAKHTPEEPLPQDTAILSAEYDAVLESGRATLSGKLQVEAFGEGLHALPLSLSGVGIRSAKLDDQPAALAEGPNGAVLLIVEGRGQHTLLLDMVLPLSTAAAQQSLSWLVPVPPATTFHMTVQGDVELKSGAAIISRRVDSDAGLTRFELLPVGGQMNLVMTLNNRRLRAQTTVLARGVLVDELTQGYERLHASFSMNVLHGATDEFRISIPDDFEVTQVATPLLARWSVEAGDPDEREGEANKVLEIKLRELTTERVVINVRADHAAPELESWHMPKLIPLDVAGFAGVVGILLEEQLTSQAIETRGVIPIDNQILTAALPASVLAAEPGMPRVRPLATYYAAQADFDVTTDFARQPAQLYATTNLLLTLTDRGLEVDGGFALLPEREKLFSFEFHIPADWSVDTVRTVEGAPLTFERYADDEGSRVRVQLPTGLSPRMTLNVQFHATYSPADWLDEWDEQTLELPAIAISGEEGVHESGAIAVRALDDLHVRPESTSGLIVLTDSEKGKYGYTDVATNLAWRYTQQDWQGTVSVTRTTPRLTGRALSFFQISPEALTSHFELTYNVEQARTQRVRFSLPENTPAEIAIRGLDDATVKETSSQTSDGRRYWDVQLADKKLGRIRLAVDFVQPLADASLTGYGLPQIRTEDVAYQSGLIAVEGSPEIDVSVVKHPRSVDMGELIDAEYQVGKRLLGVFSYVGVADQTSIDVVRRTIHALPTTIVQRAELVTLVADSGVGQTAARFALRTKALYIEIRLPADATLWAVMIDGQPALPERQEDHTVIALPAAAADQSRDLQVVYEQPIDPLKLRANIDLLAPTLWQRLERDASSEPIPLADLHWELVLPAGYRLSHVGGTVSETDPRRRFGWEDWLDWFVELGGGHGRLSQTKAAKTRAPQGATAAETPANPTPEDRMTMEKGRAFSPPAAAPMPNAGVFDDVSATKTEPAMQPALDMTVDPFGTPTAEGQAIANQPATAQPAVPLASTETAQAAGRPEEPPAQQGMQQAAQVGAGAAIASRAKSPWALAGMRSLAIDLAGAQYGQSVSFSSLGVDPNLRATLVDLRRWQWLGLACGLIVFALGQWRVPNNAAARLRYIGLVVVIALLLPPLTGWTLELEPVVQAVIAAALALVAIAIISALARRIAAQVVRIRQKRSAHATQAASTTAVVMIACASLLSTSATLRAQAPAAEPGPVTINNLNELEALIQALPSPPHVSIPPDAVVVPYDAAALNPIAHAEKVLVPYAKYAELWNAAHPDRLLTPKPPATAYAWSNAKYQTVLEGDGDLRLTGSLDIQIFAEGDVAVPLAIGGGVLKSATVDGEPARLQVVESPAQVQAQPAGSDPAQAEKQARAGAVPQNPAETLFLLHLEGKGRKQLSIEVRLKIEKRGGWRVINGRVPAAPATRLELQIPQAHTEVRFQGFADRNSLETTEAGETIDTALPTSGHIQLQWRAKIAEAAVDQGLSVNAQAVFDVQEDGLKYAWHGTFDFRRGRRDSFTLVVPGDYLVEKVIGSNVRGWNTQAVGDDQQVTVDLLATVAERESLTLFMLHDYTADPDQAATIDVPVVRVPDAMLQQGQLAVRRSSLLELRTIQSTGLSRIDTPDDSQWLAEPIDASPLPLKPYQAFRYSQVPYALELSAEPSTSRVRATAQTLLKLSQLETTLESRLILQIAERPLHHVRISVPANWKLDPPQLAIGYEWNVEPADADQTADAGQQWLDLYFASGVMGDVPIVLRGKLDQSLSGSGDGTIPLVPLPRIAVADIAEQTGDSVVASDPAFDVRAEGLQGCETALLGAAESWLAADQRSLARLLIHHTGNDYSGQLRVSRRAPQVTAFSVTNVKVTDRSVEETIYLELTIRSAGIRQISLQVPASLARTRVRGPLIREQTWTQIGSETDSPWRLVVDLQEDVMGQYSLILEHDRLPASGEQAVPIPVIETGKTEHRFVTLENSGRDELIVGERVALEPLERSQAQWRFLNTLLGGKATEAFVVRENAETPRLSFTTRERATVETVGARIGIAQTLMVVDENGAYRAVQEYRVENRTEQYLEIELPAGAKLWTVMVAGEPVKPMASLGASASGGQAANGASVGGQRLRIPLVKTAAGDLDYAVTIKYGGQMKRPDGLRITHFPLVRTININVELSQVRLRLPEADRWFNFGGSMGRVLKTEELEAGWLSFRTRQLNELTELLSRSDDNDFSKARATNNLKQLGKEIEEYRNRSDVAQTQSDELKEQLAYNSAAWSDAQKQLQKPEAQLSDALAQPSNRELLNQRFAQQGNERSYNVASERGDNFTQAPEQMGQKANASADEFDEKWLAGNSLKGAPVEEKSDKAAEMRGESSLERVMPQDAKDRLAGLPPQSQAAAKPAAPKLATPSGAIDQRQLAEAPARDEDRAGQVYRYQQRLEQQGPQSTGGGLKGGTESELSLVAPGGDGKLGGAMLGRRNAAEGVDSVSAYGMGGMGSGGLGGLGEMSMGMGGGAGGYGSAANVANMLQPPSGGPTSGPSGPPGASPASALPGYLASLDVELPVRGVEYMFTTPRGDTEITAQSISQESLSRLSMIATIIAAALILWLLAHAFVRARRSRFARVAAAAALIVIGLTLLITGTTPLYGLFALLSAIAIAISTHR